MSFASAMMVIAKTPKVGRVKTRLCPPLTAEVACEVAWASLLDTLDTAAQVSATRHVLVLDGAAGPWIPAGFEVIKQRGDGLGDRLAAAFSDVGQGGIVIAMDTPQVTAAQLTSALNALADGADSVLGFADDGGYWLIGLRAGLAASAIFAGVPMSTANTGEAQLCQLQHLGLSTVVVDSLRDIDTVDDLYVVGTGMASGRLAALVSGLS